MFYTVIVAKKCTIFLIISLVIPLSAIHCSSVHFCVYMHTVKVVWILPFYFISEEFFWSGHVFFLMCFCPPLKCITTGAEHNFERWTHTAMYWSNINSAWYSFYIHTVFILALFATSLNFEFLWRMLSTIIHGPFPIHCFRH